MNDRHKGLWDRFSVYLTIEGHHIRELESLVLRIVKPTGNSQVGKLAQSQDMKRPLLREVRSRQREEIQVLVGKRLKISRRISKKRLAIKQKYDTILGRYVDKPLKLRGTHKGVVYRARVRRNGWIYYKGYLYSSPSHVARDICRHPRNGWTFWEYEHAPGYWVKLKNLKK